MTNYRKSIFYSDFKFHITDEGTMNYVRPIDQTFYLTLADPYIFDLENDSYFEFDVSLVAENIQGKVVFNKTVHVPEATTKSLRVRLYHPYPLTLTLTVKAKGVAKPLIQSYILDVVNFASAAA